MVRMAGETRLLPPWLYEKEVYTSQYDATRDIVDEQGGSMTAKSQEAVAIPPSCQRCSEAGRDRSRMMGWEPQSCDIWGSERRCKQA